MSAPILSGGRTEDGGLRVAEVAGEVRASERLHVAQRGDLALAKASQVRGAVLHVEQHHPGDEGLDAHARRDGSSLEVRSGAEGRQDLVRSRDLALRERRTAAARVGA
jgi:hypothetical protein